MQEQKVKRSHSDRIKEGIAKSKARNRRITCTCGNCMCRVHRLIKELQLGSASLLEIHETYCADLLLDAAESLERRCS